MALKAKTREEVDERGIAGNHKGEVVMSSLLYEEYNTSLGLRKGLGIHPNG
ncbi:MAG: hypothetical protein OHK0037_37900 [Elainellaceae cyanobacterium]